MENKDVHLEDHWEVGVIQYFIGYFIILGTVSFVAWLFVY